MRGRAIVPAVAGAAILIAAATAVGQYYVPLRYDLRRGSPTYVPGREPWRGYGVYDAPNYDPYSFASVQARNYFLTGNVRAGKSFQGHTPYGDTGSQLAETLPSLRLSDFRRDSIGVEDLGTGVEYGAPLPYFPSTAQVTTPYTAGTRFAPAPYPPTGAGDALYAPPPYVSSWQVAPYAAYGPPPATSVVPGLDDYSLDRIRLPAGAWEVLRRLIEEEEGASPAPGLVAGLPGAGTPPAEEGPASLLQTPTFRFESVPSNILPPEPKTGVGPDGLPAPDDLSLYIKPQTVEAVLPGVPASPGHSPATPWRSPAGPARRQPADDQEEGPGWSTLLGEGAAPAPALRPEAHEADALIRAAETAMHLENYEKAADLFRLATAADANRPGAAFGLVHALIGRRHYYQAALTLERLLERHPDWAARPPDLKAAFKEPKTYDEVVAELADRLQYRETSRQLNFLLGYVLYAGGRAADGRPYLERAAGSLKHLQTPEKVLLEAMGGGPK
jgi:hypothetical protein